MIFTICPSVLVWNNEPKLCNWYRRCIFLKRLMTFNDQIKGLIAIGKFTSKQVKKLSGISQNLVFVDQSPDEDQYDSVVVNFERATKKILDYFIANNHEHIGFIGGKENIREKAFKEKLTMEKLFDERFSHVGRFSVDEGYRLMKEAIEEHGENLPTA